MKLKKNPTNPLPDKTTRKTNKLQYLKEKLCCLQKKGRKNNGNKDIPQKCLISTE